MLPFTPEPQQQHYYDEDTFLDPSKNLITNMAPQSYTFGKIFNQPNSSRAPMMNMNQQQQNMNYNNNNNGGFPQMSQFP